MDKIRNLFKCDYLQVVRPIATLVAMIGSLMLVSACGGIQGSLKSTDQSSTASAGSSSGNSFVSGGNSFGLNSSIGNSDNFNLDILTNNLPRMTFTNTGNVGIGTSSPTSKLQVSGTILTPPNSVASGATLDMSLSNLHTLSAVGGTTITLNNLVSGGNYTILVKDTTSRTYTFPGCTTSKFLPVNTATTVSTWSIYTILSIDNGAGGFDCLITWATGYQ